MWKSQEHKDNISNESEHRAGSTCQGGTRSIQEKAAKAVADVLGLNVYTQRN